MTIKTDLKNAGVSSDAITILEKQKILDGELLGQVSNADLITVGILLKDLMALRRLFPAAVAPEPAALPAKIVVTQEKTTDFSVLAELASMSADAIAEARKHFAGRKVFVANEDGKLDQPATEKLLEFIILHNETPERFANSNSVSVRVLNIEELLYVCTPLNPLSQKPIAPGDAMEQLDEDQRLLVAFAVVTGVILPSLDEDLVIDQVIKMTAKWRAVEADLLVARRENSSTFFAARKRLVRTPEDRAKPTQAKLQFKPESEDARKLRLLLEEISAGMFIEGISNCDEMKPIAPSRLQVILQNKGYCGALSRCHYLVKAPSTGHSFTIESKKSDDAWLDFIECSISSNSGEPRLILMWPFSEYEVLNNLVPQGWDYIGKLSSGKHLYAYNPDVVYPEVTQMDWLLAGRPGYKGGARPIEFFQYLESFKLDELRQLVVWLRDNNTALKGLDWENLGGDTKSAKVLDLLDYARRRDSLPYLMAAFRPLT